MNKFGKVAVLLGGLSAEREVSLKSGQAIINALEETGVDVVPFDPAERNLWELKSLQVDRVFIALHGRGGEDGTVQGALEFMGLPYTGSGVLGSALAMDKIRCKQLFESAKLSTARYCVVTAAQEIDTTALMAKFGKVMVKPSHEGSSIGMTQATSAQELQAALTEAFKYDDEILIEQWIDGREFTVAMLGEEALPVIEMRTPRGFYDYQAKYQVNSTEYYCPADINTAYTEQLQVMAKHAFELVGATGWGRVDAMQDGNGQFYLLEVNTVPGMTEKSLVPMAAKQNGLSFKQLVIRILEQTL
ncbi:D-alanine--D-alanine ligase [Pseudoalteromonas rubra]|uniref:D-alanine--D-alanine ligase n=1 Tax=Pseudoalteromonas rubra TaxID=43658 RepID=A0A0U3HQL2_9GAMM|nr:D-alanine--D-alanine ligase [Pseudoalteromonas rubra]ALU43256.1 D-alanine--D-alanine ligase [Pseudoalteromonas rubra]